jgi:LmbE family N-acetylglucosaminyl deacetylase
MNRLASGAHPHDLDSSCGGTLLRFSRAQEKVVMDVVMDGRAHPLGSPEQVSARSRREAQASADLISAELVWLGFPDGRLTDDIPT